MKIIIGEGGVLGAPGDPLGKESTGESWSPRTFHAQRGERAASSPWPRGKTDGGDVRGVWVKERGGSATPQEKKNTARRAVPWPAERRPLHSRGCAKSWSLQMPAKARGMLLVNY